MGYMCALCMVSIHIQEKNEFSTPVSTLNCTRVTVKTLQEVDANFISTHNFQISSKTLHFKCCAFMNLNIPMYKFFQDMTDDTTFIILINNVC